MLFFCLMVRPLKTQRTLWPRHKTETLSLVSLPCFQFSEVLLQFLLWWLRRFWIAGRKQEGAAAWSASCRRGWGIMVEFTVSQWRRSLLPSLSWWHDESQALWLLVPFLVSNLWNAGKRRHRKGSWSASCTRRWGTMVEFTISRWHIFFPSK